MILIPAGPPPVNFSLRNTIFDKISNGRAAGESWAIRPLREIVQNADDQHATSLHIRVSDEALSVYNDGRSLAYGVDADELPLPGSTYHAIGLFAGATAEGDDSRSGQFGTGLRSYHVFSETLEFHTPITILSEGGPQPSDEWRHFELNCNVLESRDIDGMPFPLPDPVDNHNLGFWVRMPWRRAVPGNLPPAHAARWSQLVWNDEKIAEIGQHCVELLPYELLGARRLREITLHVDFKGRSLQHRWVTDKTFQECQDGADHIHLSSFSGAYNAAFQDDPLLHERLDQNMDTESFIVFKTTADEGIARAAAYQPQVGLMYPMPDLATDERPHYTPMTLARERTEYFSAWACLPPTENRTAIHVDTNSSEALTRWFEEACTKLLGQVVEAHTSGLLATDAFDFLLKMLPSEPPNRWFGSALAFGALRNVWANVTQQLTDTIFVAEGVRLDEAVYVNTGNDVANEAYKDALERCGRHVLTPVQVELLERLAAWPVPPLSIANQVNTMRTFTAAFNSDFRLVEPTLETLGLDLVRTLIDITLLHPWEDTDDRFLVPIIPDATGALRPFRSQGRPVFFAALDQFNLLLGEERRPHPDISDLLSNSLPNAELQDLLSIADAFAEQHPNIEDESEQHRQISLLCALILRDDNTNPNAVQGRRMFPILFRDSVTLRPLPQHLIDNADRNDNAQRESIWNDHPADRDAFHLHPLLKREVAWVHFSKDVESNAEVRTLLDAKLGIPSHVSFVQRHGKNIIQAFFFGVRSRSLFAVDPDDPSCLNIDATFDPDLTAAEREEILESLLVMLHALIESTGGTMNTGWGNTQAFRTSVPFLKDSSGARRLVEHLSYEQDETLSTLFGLSPLLETHRELFGDVLTIPAGNQGQGGFGISRRPDERTVRNHIGTHPEMDGPSRDAILRLLLNSGEAWGAFEFTGDQVEDAYPNRTIVQIPWVNTTAGGRVALYGLILPTHEWEDLVGPNHPSMLRLPDGVDANDETTVARAAELGLVTEVTAATLLDALLRPEHIWAGIPEDGGRLYRRLLEFYQENEERPQAADRRNRIWDVQQSELVDNAWLLPTIQYEYAVQLFPEHRCVDSGAFGAQMLPMIEAWILPREGRAPTTSAYIEALRNSTELADDALAHAWEIILKSQIPDGTEALPPATNIIDPLTQHQRRELGSLLLVDIDVDNVELPEIVHVVRDGENDVLERLERLGAPSIRGVGPCQTLAQVYCDDAFNNDASMWMLHVLLALKSEYLANTRVWPFQRYDAARHEHLRFFEASTWNHGYAPEQHEGHTDAFRQRCYRAGMPLLKFPDKESTPNLYEKYLSVIRHKWELTIRTRDAENVHGEPNERLTTALRQIVSALEQGDFWERTVLSSDTLSVELLQTPVGQEEFVEFNGSPIVRRDSPGHLGYSLDVNDLPRTWRLRLVSNQATDEDIVNALRKAGRFSPNLALPRDLVRYPEEEWERRCNVPTPPDRFPRPLLEHLQYWEQRVALRSKYDGCQVCRRSTPIDRHGTFCERVTGVFRAHGLYRWPGSPTHLGTVLYLCPSHMRSHEAKLLKIPFFEDVRTAVERNEDLDDLRIRLSEQIENEDQIPPFEVYEQGIGEAEPGDYERIPLMDVEHAELIRNVALDYLEFLRNK